MTVGGSIFLLVLVGLVIAIVVTYNKLVGLRQRSEEAWSDIDVQLKRRTDLVPNLVETVKGYAAHERGTLDQVVRARGAAMAAQTPEARAQAENQLTGALRQLFALAESYPDLKANQSFLELQASLGELEETIELAPLLQRRRPRSQHDDRQLSVQPDRVVLPLRQARILRARPPRRPSGPARLFRELIASAGASPRWRSCWRPRLRPWRRREGCSRSTASSPASWSTPTGASSFGRTSRSSSEGRTRASFGGSPCATPVTGSSFRSTSAASASTTKGFHVQAIEIGRRRPRPEALRALRAHQDLRRRLGDQHAAALRGAARLRERVSPDPRPALPADGAGWPFPRLAAQREIRMDGGGPAHRDQRFPPAAARTVLARSVRAMAANRDRRKRARLHRLGLGHAAQDLGRRTDPGEGPP